MADQRFETAGKKFQSIHQEDPKQVELQGRSFPWSVLYHRRLSEWVDDLAPDASEPLRLAARCQHLKRWAIPRSEYPRDRMGYRRWRRELAQLHARLAREILSDVGYDEETIGRVEDFLLKKRLKVDPEVQLFEDAICLTFLENEFADFASQHEPEKIVSILQKTLRKMSERGREKALELKDRLPDDGRSLVEKAATGFKTPGR